MINEKLKFFREKRGLSQKEFAEKLFLSQNTISQYENGKRNIHDKLLEQMAKALDIQVILFEKSYAQCSFQTLEEKMEFLEEFSKAYEDVKMNIAPYDFDFGEERELDLLKKLVVNADIQENVATYILFPIDLDTANMDCVFNCLTQSNVLSEKKAEFFWEGLGLAQNQREELNLDDNLIENKKEMVEEESDLATDIYYNVNGIKTDSNPFVQIFHDEKRIFVECDISTKHYQYGEVVSNIRNLIHEEYKDYSIIVS